MTDGVAKESRIARQHASEDAAQQEEESIESQLFRDAMLNGDERFNKLVKMIDTRFKSAARRDRERWAEFRQLRSDLQPVIEFMRLVPWITGVFGLLGTALTVAFGLGLIP